MKKTAGMYMFIFLMLLGTCIYAQSDDPALLSIDRIFNSREFASERFGPARWLEDFSGYTTLELSEAVRGGIDIVKYDPASGRRSVLVSASRLIPAGAGQPLDIEDYAWSPDGTRLLVFTNSERVWRQNTRGDYYVLDIESGTLSKLGGDAAPSTLMFATFSPDGNRVAYVRENNLFVETIGVGITQLTSDGSGTIINGTFDWVYEEEFGLRNGFRWSPDGSRIAFWQLDAEGVGEFYMINNTDDIYSKIIPVQYPKAGTTNSACRIGVVNAEGGAIRWFKSPGNPRNTYIARMEWAANSQEVVFQHLNRLQNTLTLMLGDAQTGDVRTVLVDKDDAWVNVVNDLKWFDDGEDFTWVSERDGWRHVYLVSRDGREMRPVTPGDYDVVSVESIDSKNGRLYFIASPDNAAQRYLYMISLDGRGAPERLTPADQPGTHSYQVSADAQWAIHTYSSFEKPPVIDLVRLPGHERVRMLVDNAGLAARAAKLKKQPVEFHRIDAGGVQFDAYMMKPYDFDPAKKYPVLFHVYGEPAGQTVLDRWGGSRWLWHLMLTQQGYIVMSVDNRGTPAPRGREWRKCVYGQIGILASQDQAAAARAIINRWDFVDPDRIGIWGWSGGGSMSLNMIFRHPELYGTAMSVAPVSNQRYYDTIYQERYMGLPDQNEYGFKNGSPITFAHQLEGNLLLVHGTGDDNVHYQNAEALVNELIRHNKQFTMMSYPNRSHGIYEGRNTTRHLYTLMTRYLMEKMPPGPKTR